MLIPLIATFNLSLSLVLSCTKLFVVCVCVCILLFELIKLHGCMVVRDAEDHIAWLLEHGWHEKALAAVEAGQGRSELLDEVI